MHELGFNYRITDIQCALGLSQLKKLPDFLNKRSNIAKFYTDSFEGDDRFVTPFVKANVKHAYHLYPLQVDFERTTIDKKEFFGVMKANDIGLQVHYIPVHLQPFYRHRYGFKQGDFPLAEQFYRKEISIPMYPQLGKEDLEYITGKIKSLAK
jgi:dTDP-4-amino-4,6-dideoxygalactose transaminase